MKHHLHTGKEKYFSERCDYNPRVKIKSLDYAFTICFDVENPSHWKRASSSKADVYSARIFYTAAGIENLHSMISKSSYKYNMNVIISNYFIDSYGLLAGGGSGIWNNQGDNITLLDSSSTGLAIARKQNNKWVEKTILI